MGGFTSTHRGFACKGDGKADGPSESPSKQASTSTPAAEDVKMSEAKDRSEEKDVVGEPQLGSLRVKDPDAWKGSPSSRPRSALKSTGGSGTRDEMAEAAAAVTERTPSGRRTSRKVSFQVQGLGTPPGVCDGDGLGEGGNHQAHKRVRGSEEFSMKYLVDKFYTRVLSIPELRPFFDGVDMTKLKNQQEALMLLVFGGHELLDDELPGLSADLRLIHLHLLFEGLNLNHWQLFADTFSQTLDELHQIPEDIKHHAKAYMATTKHFFRPIEPHEWPPKVVYKGWTKRSCPFHTSSKKLADTDLVSEVVATGDDVETAAPSAATTAAPTRAGTQGCDSDSDFVLPGLALRDAAPAKEV